MVTADALRQVVQALPEAEERETWGHPTFRVRDKMFAAMSDDGREASVKATREEQAALTAPKRLVAAYDSGQPDSGGRQPRPADGHYQGDPAAAQEQQ